MMLIAVEATIGIAVTFAVCAIARRARASLRHSMYAALFCFLLLLPFSPKVMPPVMVPVTVPAAAKVIPTTIVTTVQQAAAPVAAAVPNRSWLPIVYLAGVALMLTWLTLGVFRLRRLAANGDVWLDGTRLATDVACRNDIRRAVLVVLSDAVSVPMTFGFRRQTIILPLAAKEWDDDSLCRALRHELEHVRRDDWILQLVARTACALYWPHPLVWIALRRFCAEAERSCDDAVVRSFEPATYAQQLVTLARSLTRRTRVPALAMASPARLTERVHAILDPSQRRGPHGSLAGLTTIAIMLGTLALFGSVRLVEAAAPVDEHEMRDTMDEAIRDALGNYGESFREGVINAAEQGDIEALRGFLDTGLDVNESFTGDGTALLIAAKHGHIDAVRFLLDRGADPNVPSPGDGNPLIAASEAGQTEIVELLLDRGARIDEVVPGDENALITACAAGQLDVVRLLITRGANVNARVWADGREWRTPLKMARRSGNDEIVRVLRSAGAH